MHKGLTTKNGQLLIVRQCITSHFTSYGDAHPLAATTGMCKGQSPIIARRHEQEVIMFRCILGGGL